MSVSSDYPIIVALCVNCTPPHFAFPLNSQRGYQYHLPLHLLVYQTVKMDLRVSALPRNAADSRLYPRWHSRGCYTSVPLHLLWIPPIPGYLTITQLVAGVLIFMAFWAALELMEDSSQVWSSDRYLLQRLMKTFYEAKLPRHFFFFVVRPIDFSRTSALISK